jgi:trigger factor
MNITKEVISDYNELVRIHLKPEDYTPVISKEIKKTARTIQIPGFRPGHVPEQLVRSRYGKAILVEEVNKMVIDALYKYFEDNKMDVLGQPLPVHSGNGKNSFDNPGDFEFAFEIGLKPQFSIPMPPKKTVDYYVIKVSDSEVDKEIERLQERHGEVTHPEQADEQCYLQMSFTSCDENGKPEENSLQSTAWIKPDAIKDNAIRNKILALRKGESITVNLKEAAGSAAGVSALINKKIEEVENHSPYYHAEMKLIEKTIPAELNQELFDKIYGKDAVTDVAAMREKIKEAIAREYRSESEHKFHHDIKDVLVEECNITLPDSFLKKWIAGNSEKPIAAEDIEKHYRHYAYDMKWMLIRNELTAQNGITVSEEELKNYARHYVMRMFIQYGITQFDQINLEPMAEKYLKDEKNRSDAENNLLERKVFEWVSAKVKRKEKEVTLDEFLEIVRNHHH